MGLLTILKKMKQEEKEMRILMLGLDNAGKTTILKKFNGEDINTISPTLGFNIKTLEHKNFKLNVWDVGGQKSLRSYWRNYFESTDGLVWVVDSADKLRMADCKQELHSLLQEERLAGATLLVFANKQDIPGSLTSEEIRKLLDLDNITTHHWQIQGCSAVTGENLVEGIDWLMDLKDYHEASIVNFMRFSRAQRGLSLRSIRAAYKDVENHRLRNETTLTVDEVQDILEELWDIAHEEIDRELSHQSHTYILLLRQLFIQAENWHLKLQADISELENKELLDKVRMFEEETFSNKKSNYQPPKLEPVNDTGGTILLKEKISSLQTENHALKDKIRYLEEKLIEYSEARSSSRDNAKKSSNRYNEDDENRDLEEKMSQLRNELQRSSDSSKATQKSIENEMISIKHRYLEIQEQLRMAEKELEKKFNQTNAYKNMKQMLDRKNEQIKDLRRRLNRYEPPDDE
ncbi:ADP-ribosylation factor 2 [Brachionus plicatilis]|uniref:ADP-ribosylation factor-like protein 2 n=1 Tax=Brachionus plicatilis TaxID=10195 RepID=A0A3M7RD14_BRAPC|nr:ADP-ribosylation factor 2 [Brachionus plicatilis]